MMLSVSDLNPLWPAGHLPHKGGETVRHGPGQTSKAQWRPSVHGMNLERSAGGGAVSPLVGEMAGRPEGVFS